MKKKTILVVGSEGFIGKNLILKLKKNFNCISVDIKKKRKRNYFFCDLRKGKDFKKLLSNLNKKDKIFAAINTIYPFKSSNFLQNNLKYFLNNISSHLLCNYNFNKELFEFFSKAKQKKIIINFSSIYGHKPPNFKIYEGTNLKMPIEYAISKASLNIMVKYFNQWTKYRRENINFFCISPAGVLDKQSKKFQKNYLKYYQKKMISVNLLTSKVEKILDEKIKKNNSEILITGGAKF